MEIKGVTSKLDYIYLLFISLLGEGGRGAHLNYSQLYKGLFKVKIQNGNMF